MFGSLAHVQLVWNLADLFMGLMAMLNIAVILLLGKTAFRVLNDYTKQRKKGENPVFYAKTIPGLKNTECWGEEDR
jgi:AGCS family alanine or glycine:cation symporter